MNKTNIAKGNTTLSIFNSLFAPFKNIWSIISASCSLISLIFSIFGPLDWLKKILLIYFIFFLLVAVIAGYIKILSNHFDLQVGGILKSYGRMELKEKILQDMEEFARARLCMGKKFQVVEIRTLRDDFLIIIKIGSTTERQMLNDLKMEIILEEESGMERAVGKAYPRILQDKIGQFTLAENLDEDFWKSIKFNCQSSGKPYVVGNLSLKICLPEFVANRAEDIDGIYSFLKELLKNI